MVLDDASPIGSEGFSDDAPDSDSDPYSSSGKSNPVLDIDMAKFPQPFPVLGPLFGYNSKLISKLVNMRIEAATKVLERPPTEDEATAIAYWTAKNISVTSWGAPLGIAAGAWRAYETADTFRFPFYKPAPDTFKALSWPSAKVAFISGPRAVAAWHMTRLLAYGFVGRFFGSILSISYGMSVFTVGQITDPRLKNYVESMRKVAQSARGRPPNESRNTARVGGVQKKDAATTSRDGIREMGGNTSTDTGDYGDTRSSETPAILEDAIMPDADKRPPESGERPARKSSAKETNVKGPRGEKHIQDFDDDFNEGSPTGNSVVEDKVVDGGSAWERIRRQAGGQPAGNRGSGWSTKQEHQGPRPDQRTWRRDSPRHPQQRKQGADSMMGSLSEEDKHVAKDQAQKEFDARIEQERRGGDFSSDSDTGDQKRW